MFSTQKIAFPLVNIYDVISLFAADLEESKISMWGKGLNTFLPIKVDKVKIKKRAGAVWNTIYIVSFKWTVGYIEVQFSSLSFPYTTSRTGWDRMSQPVRLLLSNLNFKT